MLHLITGRIGSGKTPKMLSIIEKVISCEDKRAILIVPEQYSLETEKTLLLNMGAIKADKISVYSFTFMAKLLLKELGVLYKNQIDDSTRAMLMALALEAVEDKLEFYSKSRYSTGFINELLSTVKELRQCNISSNDLLNFGSKMSARSLKSKITELSYIESAYQALIENSFADDQTLLDLLHDALKTTNCFKNKTVFIDGFRGFTAQEYKIIEDMLRLSDDVYVTLCTDKITELNDKGSVFAHTRKTASKLCKLNYKLYSQKTEVILTESTHFANDELKAFEQRLYTISPEKYEASPDNIEIINAENFVAECDFVAANIKRLVTEEGYRLRDIAVVSRDSANYERQIKSALKKYGLNVYIDKRQPIMNQPIIGFVTAALKITFEGVTTENVMKLLKTGMTKLTDEEIGELENYTLMWQINGNRWFSDFKGHPDGFGKEMREVDAKKLEEINELRKSISVPIYKFKEQMKDATGESAAKAVYDLLLSFNVAESLKAFAQELKDNEEYELALQQNRVWDFLMSILDNIASALKNSKVSAKRFYELFTIMISSFSMGTVPVGLDEVTVGSADRIRLSSPKAVFAVGVTQGVFPYVQTSKMILSRNERDEIRELGIELGNNAEEDVIEERFISYITLCSATERLFISYPRKDLKGTENSPSELVSQVKKIFPKVKVIDTATVPSEEFIRSKSSAFEILAKNYKIESPLSSSLKDYFSTQDEYKGKLLSLSHAAEKKQFKIQDEKIALKLFGKDMYFSASRADVYHCCPFNYFCKYGIKIQPRTKAEFSPMQRGTIFHYVLENLIKEYGSDNLVKMSKDEVYRAVEELLNLYYESNMSPDEVQTLRMQYQYKNLSKTICIIAEKMIKEFSQSDFKPIDFELPIDNDSEVKPIIINLDDGGTIRLRGSVDRVDMMKTEDKTFVRVMDYKSKDKKFSLSEVLYGLNMQMLIYLFSIWKNGSGKYKDVTPAGVLYMPIKAKTGTLERDATDEDILQLQINGYKMNGIVLDDSRAIHGMDNSDSGCFIPVKYDEKTNKYKGSLIDYLTLSGLYDKITEILKSMGDKLHQGIIKAEPTASAISSSYYKDACQHCDYKSVCGYENDAQYKVIKEISNDEIIQQLTGGDNNA